MQVFSPAQCFGYVAFVLGTTAFLQKKDKRLKFFNGVQSIAYAIHFAMLGAPPASASSAISSIRSLLSIKFRRPWLAVFFIVVNIAFGFVLVKRPVGWVPVFGSCAATYAVFCLKGIPMRIGFFVGTVCWLTNNIVTGSIGGTALELVIGTANISTMVRLIVDLKKQNRGQIAPPPEVELEA
jgi:hypothetical protein